MTSGLAGAELTIKAMAKVIWADSAIQDLDAIADYIAKVVCVVHVLRGEQLLRREVVKSPVT
jgi:hypothetical protein